MARAHNPALVILILSLPVGPIAQARPNPTKAIAIDELVQSLGTDDTDLERIKLLVRRPKESARLLVAGLHPVTGVRLLSGEREARWKDTLHVVWCLRALRYITGGLEFRGKTAHRFGSGEIEQRREWFVGDEQFSKDRTVRFFGVWMSRDSTYIAPRDAQIEIIHKWKEWYAQYGKTFRYVNPDQEQKWDIWYF